MFEIWRHIDSGKRYLVVVHAGRPTVAAGPLRPHEDPRAVLAEHSNQEHNTWALLDMRQSPGEYVREYTSDRPGQVVALPDPPTPG